MTKDSAELDGTEVEPTTEGSKSGSGQPSSAASNVESEIKQLKATVESLTRIIQSDKDRAVKKVGQRLDAVEGSLREVLQSAKKENLSVDDILSNLDAEAAREERELVLEMARAFKAGGPSSLGGNQQKSGVDVDAILSDLELNKDDLRVKEFRSRNFQNREEALSSAIALRKSITTKQPSDADTPSDVSKESLQSKQAQLQQQYDEGSKNLRGQALINFKMKMRKQGLRSIS